MLLALIYEILLIYLLLVTFLVVTVTCYEIQIVTSNKEIETCHYLEVTVTVYKMQFFFTSNK